MHMYKPRVYAAGWGGGGMLWDGRPNASAGTRWRQMNDGEDNGYMMEQEQALLTGTSAADEDEDDDDDDDAFVAAAKTEPDAYLQKITFVAGGKWHCGQT
jgi:hypothetical protein